MSLLNYIQTNKTQHILLGVSVLFFVIKGVSYALIGSYIPLFFIFIVISGLILSFKKSLKAYDRMIKLWVILIIIWPVVRLIFWVYLEIDTKLTESHLREQFGLVQNLISLAMLVLGITLIRRLKKQ
jgi:hypothetical protein